MTHKSRKGQPQGRKQPFTREDVALIRATLKAHKRWRDLALFEIALDTMLRTGDLLRLTVRDLRHPSGKIKHPIEVVQEKTKKRVSVSLGPKAQDALDTWVRESHKEYDDFLFTPLPCPHAEPVSGTIYRRLIKSFAKIAGKDPSQYSGHSSRRTKPVIIYKSTGNFEAVKTLLGHTTLSSTSAYLGVSQEEAFEIAAKFDNI